MVGEGLGLRRVVAPLGSSWVGKIGLLYEAPLRPSPAAAARTVSRRGQLLRDGDAAQLPSVVGLAAMARPAVTEEAIRVSIGIEA